MMALNKAAISGKRLCVLECTWKGKGVRWCRFLAYPPETVTQFLLLLKSFFLYAQLTHKNQLLAVGMLQLNEQHFAKTGSLLHNAIAITSSTGQSCSHYGLRCA